jgi:hypothetical protein
MQRRSAYQANPPAGTVPKGSLSGGPARSVMLTLLAETSRYDRTRRGAVRRCVIAFAEAVLHVGDARTQIAAIDREGAGLRCGLAADDVLVGLQQFRLDPRRPPIAAAAALVGLGRADCAAFTDGPRARRSAIARAHGALMSLPADESRERATLSLGSAVMLLLLDLEDASGLTYDTNVETVNLGDAITARIPAATERLQQGAAALEIASASNGVAPARRGRRDVSRQTQRPRARDRVRGRRRRPPHRRTAAPRSRRYKPNALRTAGM